MVSSLGAGLALLAAFFFGVGDFFGGLGSRRASAFQVLAISSAVATGLMVFLGVITGEKLPTTAAFMWAALAGLCGSTGLAALYKGLSAGKAAVVSPVSGVVAVILPVLVSSIFEGLPGPRQMIGFLIALPGIWLVSSSGRGDLKEGTLRALGLGLLAGLAFGLFFIFLARVPDGPIFGPMAAVKGASLVGAMLLIIILRQPLPRVKGNPAALMAGVLDPTANTLYMLSTSYTRLDIAAVLSSLYPAVTVVCSGLFLKEEITPAQWGGLALSVAAIALISS